MSGPQVSATEGPVPAAVPEIRPGESLPSGDDDENPHARARSRALRVLARREVSRKDLSARLRRAGFGAGIAGEVLDDLEAEGLLDDRRFCMLYLRSQARSRPRSWRLLIRDAAEKGVSREIIESVRVELEAETTEEDLAAAAARKKARTSRGDPDALRRALAGRGFTPSVAEQAIRGVPGTGMDRGDGVGSYEDI